jgi:ribosomal protein S18 acetylase RimI-like enzyme
MTAAPVRHEIRKMTLADVDAIAAAMARAFADDPLQVWIFPELDGRLEKLERMFALQARYSSVPMGTSYTDESLSCAAFWMPPGHELPDAAAMQAMSGLTAIIGDDALVRLQSAYAAMLAAHPKDPHYYLAGLGTDPPRQGQGLGSAAMAPVLARCDADSIPAFLESTKERNVGFYEHHGFRVMRTIAPAPDGPPMWLMWRDPQ